MQIYKEFTILSSRPNKSELKKAKHHLYGLISVKKYFSAGDWLKEAKRKINLCLKNKKLPIIVGGTGLYFNTITKGISKIPDIDSKTRTKVRNLFKKLGYKKFYEKLLILDPKVKNKILPSDSQRTQRAYEVKLKTKKSLFDWIADTKSDFLDYDIKKIFLNTPREELLTKIYNRTEEMFKQNCITEVKKFNAFKLKKTLSAHKLIGVQEITEYLDKNLTLNQCKELINIKTRQYAKRQNPRARRHMKNWNKIKKKNFSILLKKSLKAVS